MAEVIPFTRQQTPHVDKELEAALESALIEVRAGRLRSVLAVLMNGAGREFVMTFGAYRKRAYVSHAGFRLQAQAEDSTLG